MAVYKETNRLEEVIRDAPVLKLERPYQRGWVRFFVLSDQARARVDAPELERGLGFVRNHQYCRKGQFRGFWDRTRKGDTQHRLKTLSISEVFRKEIPEELLKYFCYARFRVVGNVATLRELRQRNWGGLISFRYPEFCVSVVEPYWVTHCQVHYPDIESRIDELINRFEGLGGWGRLMYINGYRAHWQEAEKEKKRRRRDRLLREELRDAIGDWEDEQMEAKQGVVRTTPFFASLFVGGLVVRVHLN